MADRLDPDGREVEALAPYVDDVPLRFCSDASPAATGRSGSPIQQPPNDHEGTSCGL
jgi:hypothetical protein